MTSFRIVRNQVVLSMAFNYLVKPKTPGFYVVDRRKRLVIAGFETG